MMLHEVSTLRWKACLIVIKVLRSEKRPNAGNHAIALCVSPFRPGIFLFSPLRRAPQRRKPRDWKYPQDFQDGVTREISNVALNVQLRDEDTTAKLMAAISKVAGDSMAWLPVWQLKAIL